MSIVSYRLRNRVQKLYHGPRDKVFLARLGDGSGTVIVPGQTLYRYVRPIDSDGVLVVRRGAAADIEGLRVWIGADTYYKHRLSILGVSAGDGTSGVGALLSHADNHYENGSDPVWVTDKQITPLLVYPTTGLVVQVNPGWIVYQGQPVFVSTTTIDLTTSIPGSGARYSLVRVSSAGAVDIQDGDAVASLVDLSVSDIPECETGYAPIAFVRLYFGQTVLSKLTTAPDVRMLVWGGGLFETEIVFNDTEGDPVDVDATAAADGVSTYPARRDHRHHLSSHEHSEADITDLEHDAVKIQGAPIDAPGAGDDQKAIIYDNSVAKFVYGEAGSGHTIQADGVPQTERTNLNFVGFEVTDDPGNDATVVEMPSGAYAETIGDGVEVEYEVTHNLGSQDILVQLWDLSGADPLLAILDPDSIKILDEDSIEIVFSDPPAEDSYRVVILKNGGEGGGASALSELNDVDIPEPEDGQLLEYDEETGKWIAVDPSSYAPTEAEFITSASHTGLSAEVVIPGLAGCPDILPGSPSVYDDEFDSLTLDGKWTEVTHTAATHNVNTTWKSCIFADMTGDQAYIIQQSFAPAGAFSITAKFHFCLQSNYQGCRIYIFDNDESDAVRACIEYSSTVNGDLSTKDTGTWTYQRKKVVLPGSSVWYVHIQRDASNNWRTWISHDGKSFWAIGTVYSKNMTVHHFNIALEQSGATIPVRTGIDWVRANWMTL